MNHTEFNIWSKEEALHKWFNKAVPGLKFYRAASVPLSAQPPYGTYTAVTGAFPDEQMAITVNLWFPGESEESPDKAAQALSDAIGRGGARFWCRDGIIWLTRGSPWCQSIADSEFKRRYINITAEFLTHR